MALCHSLKSPAIVGHLRGVWELPRSGCPHWPALVEVVKLPGLSRIPWFRTPAVGWGLPGLGVPESPPRHPASTPGPGGPYTHLSVWFASRAQAQVRSLGIPQMARNSRGRHRDWDPRATRQPSSGFWKRRLSSRASRWLAPPCPAAPANPREGPAHPRVPLGKFNLRATPLAGLVCRRL